MDNPLKIDKENEWEGERKTSFFKSTAFEISLSKLKSRYRMPDGKIIEVVVKI
jgi:hypothetical protein